MNIENHTNFEFLENVARDAFTSSGFMIDGKPVEYITILYYDEDNHVAYLQVHDCRFLMWIRSGTDDESDAYEWGMYLFSPDGKHNLLFTGETNK